MFARSLIATRRAAATLARPSRIARAPLQPSRLVSSSPPTPQPPGGTALASIEMSPVVGDVEPALVPNTFVTRMLLTTDIAVSKLFAGGFGWQAMSVVAADAGFKASDIGFALATGVGDCLGVGIGHILISALKAMFTGAPISKEIPVAVWLGSAAFCSGTLWQPAVNFFVGLGLSFPAVFATVGFVCGFAFFVGLRAGRAVLRNHGIAQGNAHNLVEDAGLSVAIGGAAGMFCATDITIPKNAFDTVFGVTPVMTPLEGCMRAGGSTAAGFALLHSIQNTRASENGAFITRGTFSKVSAVIGHEIVAREPSAQNGVRRFLDERVNLLFDKIDANGDGRLTPQEIVDHHKSSHGKKAEL